METALATRKVLTCRHCGHKGKGVIERTVYVGGQGWVKVVECEDRVACWKRWDKQHLIKEDERLRGKEDERDKI